MWKKLSFLESFQTCVYKNTEQFKCISTIANILRQRKYTMTMEDIQHVHHCLLCQRRKCISQANQVNLYLINTSSFECTLHTHQPIEIEGEMNERDRRFIFELADQADYSNSKT